MINILSGDCREQMRTLADCSVDAVVCDPPYELGFMGKKWDATGIAYDQAVWREALRVLKPGGHLLAFSGTRTYHRMAVAIEDAGFEVRDMIAWHYGRGFPKSLDVSKAIDKAAGAEREILSEVPAFGIGGNGCLGGHAEGATMKIDAGAVTDEAREWQGWGTALKPATEPICVGRKPLSEKTVAANVLRWGTGALNVDGCRIGSEVRHAAFTSLAPCHGNALGQAGTAEDRRGTQGEAKEYVGRWPANLVHDGSDEIVGQFPDSNGSGPARTLKRGQRHDSWGMADQPGALEDAGSGSAARFFYCAKASRSERGAFNDHPTVKPTKLMRWLVRLITPPGGIVLDPFLGSGSTALAAMAEGCRFIGVELNPEYVAIAKRRLGLDLV